MMFGSHNTFSYAKPKHWFMYPFAFMARCQRIDWKKQYILHNIRVFDLRVWFDKDGFVQVRHGLMLYKLKLKDINEMLSYFNKKGDCYVRVILESVKWTHTKHREEFAEKCFKNFCNNLVTGFPHIRFFGGNRKYDWNIIHRFPNPPITVIDKYSSTTSLFNSDNHYLRIIDDWIPILYAKLRNKKNVDKYIRIHCTDYDTTCLLYDFIDIK